MTAALAGPWLHDAGAGYGKAAIGAFSGEAASGAQYRDLQGSLYGEYGMPAGFQLEAYAPLVLAVNQDAAARYLSLGGGDGTVALAHRLVFRHPVALSAAVAAKVPLYAERDRARHFGELAARFPEVGDGHVDVDARLDAGLSLPRGAWVQATAGWRHRFGAPNDGVPWATQVGLSGRRGWAGLDAGGVVACPASADTREWTRVGAFGALRLGRAVTLESWAAGIPRAVASQRGVTAGLGLGVRAGPPS